jgi:hypothetical protein
METLTFYPAKGGYTRAPISADNWENVLGLSCDKKHVVGILNSSPLILAISGTFQGTGKNMQGILPDGTRFGAWPVSLHDKGERAGRRISRKSFLGWLPEDQEVMIEVQPLDGENAILTLYGTESSWTPEPLQTFLFEDIPDDWFDVDDEIEDTPEIEEIATTPALLTHARSKNGPRLQVRFPRSGEIFDKFKIPAWLGVGEEQERNLTTIAMWVSESVLCIGPRLDMNDRKMTKRVEVKLDGWTVAEYFHVLGLHCNSRDVREEFEAILIGDNADDWLIKIDLNNPIRLMEPKKEETIA